MKIFISWSGERSRTVAAALSSWLKDVFLDVDTFMSDHNITAGTRWEQSLNSQLESSNFGILCLNAENLNEPWLLFEAGSLAKIVNEAHVVPYRFNLKATDVEYPLAQFQGADADEKGTFRLVESINNAREIKVPEEQLRRLFKKWWPDFQEELNKIPLVESSTSQQRTEMELLEEILQIVRQVPLQPIQVPPPITSSSGPPIVWSPGKNIHNLTEDEIALMNNEELKKYFAQVGQRWWWTSSPGEENILDVKMRIARAELERRGLRVDE